MKYGYKMDEIWIQNGWKFVKQVGNIKEMQEDDKIDPHCIHESTLYADLSVAHVVDEPLPGMP
jgi:hypothetical protein